MRATISFETEVDQVEGTMAVVACSEEHNLRAAADILSNYTVLDGSLLDALTEVLRLLDMSTDQLRQYHNRLVNFEGAKYGTILPQEADARPLMQAVGEVKEAAQVLRKFDSFLDQIGEEDPDGTAVEEG